MFRIPNVGIFPSNCITLYNVIVQRLLEKNNKINIFLATNVMRPPIDLLTVNTNSSNTS